MSDVTLYAGDCLSWLRADENGYDLALGYGTTHMIPDGSVDAIVTDPPYGLGFMGKEWDKPGQATRSTTTSVELKANPYSAGKAEYGGASYGTNYLASIRDFQSWCEQWATECLRVLKPGGHMLAFGGTRTFHRLACAIEDAGFEVRDSIAWLYGSGFPKSLNLVDGTGERTGWGTALKPAFEPIVVARKPLVGTVAANVLAHGTGALNIDECRIGDGAESRERVAELSQETRYTDRGGTNFAALPGARGGSASGRWPSNVVLDESQAEALDDQSGQLTSGANPTRRGSDKFRDAYGDFSGQEECTPARGVDVGGASRFFYTAKAGADERVRIDAVAHPTVKPLTLMRWLVRLVTPVGGTVLDLFAGSGTTVEACILEGFDCIAMEREPSYLPLIQQRIDRRRDPVAAVRGSSTPDDDLGLFGLLDGTSA